MASRTGPEPDGTRIGAIGRALVARLDLEGVLELVLDAARELSGARYAALGVLDERGRELERFLTLGIDQATEAEIGHLPRGGGVLGELIRHPEPLRLADLHTHPSFEGFPPGHPDMRALLALPIRIRGQVWGNLYLTESREGAFGAAEEAAIGELVEWAAVAIENARLYEGLARRRDEAERDRDRAEHSALALAVMTDIARSVGGETDVSRILALIVDRGRALVQARALLILLAEDGELVAVASAGELGEDLRGRRFASSGTVAGSALRNGRAERIADSGGETEIGGLGVRAEAAIIVPLVFRGTASGVLVALDRESDGPGFGVEDERLLRSFAASAATAVATARSVEADRLRHSLEAAEGERRRWARELHDETLQALGGLRMLHSAALRGAAGPEELRDALREGIELIDVEIDNLSALIAELRPAALDEIGLVAALRTLADRKAREGGVEVDVLARLGDGDQRLDPETENVLYRLVQEALNNAVKHAGASRVEAALERIDGVVEVSVLDDGRGFDPGAAGGGFGLIGMRERVELAGGELRIEAAPGEGTRIRARIPVGAATPAHRSSSPQSST
jgi:signal transduction histidine kinase